MGKKPTVPVTNENESISVQKQQGHPTTIFGKYLFG